MQETVYPPKWVFASTKCRFCGLSSPFCTCAKSMVTLSSFVNQRLLIFVFFCILYVFTEFFSFPFVFRPENFPQSPRKTQSFRPYTTIYCSTASGFPFRFSGFFFIFSPVHPPVSARCLHLKRERSKIFAYIQ